MPLGIVYDDIMTLHREKDDDTHVESPARITTIWELVKENRNFIRLLFDLATMKELESVHSIEHIEAIGRQQIPNGWDMYNNEYTWTAARAAAGAVLRLCKGVVEKEIRGGAAVVRPPGHHADMDSAYGFCFFNNVVIGAKYLVGQGLKVLIVDWDVHHGDGTESLVEGAPNVCYYSIHRYDEGEFYPRTGHPREFVNVKNVGYDARGKYIGDDFYLREFANIPEWLGRLQFHPDVILVSAGFDAAEGDPLGQVHVTPSGYSQMTRMLMGMCPTVILVLEGGYNLEAMSKSFDSCMTTLATD